MLKSFALNAKHRKTGDRLLLGFAKANSQDEAKELIREKLVALGNSPQDYWLNANDQSERRPESQRRVEGSAQRNY